MKSAKSEVAREERCRHDTEKGLNDSARVLIDKLVGTASQQQRRQRLLGALEEAVEQYRSASEEERKAFFHGMLTGYAVALKLW